MEVRSCHENLHFASGVDLGSLLLAEAETLDCTACQILSSHTKQLWLHCLAGLHGQLLLEWVGVYCGVAILVWAC